MKNPSNLCKLEILKSPTNKDNKNEKPDLIRDTFDNINRDLDFSECCARGEPDDIKRLKSLLEKDPKKFSYNFFLLNPIFSFWNIDIFLKDQTLLI